MDIVTFIIVGILTWVVGLGPALLLRFVVLRRPLGKLPAIGITVALIILNIAIIATDTIFSPEGTHQVQVLIAFAIFAILSYGRKDSRVRKEGQPYLREKLEARFGGEWKKSHWHSDIGRGEYCGHCKADITEGQTCYELISADKTHGFLCEHCWENA